MLPPAATGLRQPWPGYLAERHVSAFLARVGARGGRQAASPTVQVVVTTAPHGGVALISSKQAPMTVGSGGCVAKLMILAKQLERAVIAVRRSLIHPAGKDTRGTQAAARVTRRRHKRTGGS